jgi:anti-sigma regulatory factor (Ser/Thr protein kinase)
MTCGALILRNHIKELERLTAWVQEVSAAKGLSPSEAYALRLALEEIVSNVMKYAYGPEVDLPIEVGCHQEADRLEVTIADQGPAFDPLKAEPPDIPPDAEDRKDGGLGIHLIRAIIDEIRYAREDRRNRLTLCFRLGARRLGLRCCSSS